MYILHKIIFLPQQPNYFKGPQQPMLGKQMEQAQKTKGDQENQPAFRILFDSAFPFASMILRSASFLSFSSFHSGSLKIRFTVLKLLHKKIGH